MDEGSEARCATLPIEMQSCALVRPTCVDPDCLRDRLRRTISGRAKALLDAMKKVRAEPGFADPHYWAAFDLVGEPGK